MKKQILKSVRNIGLSMLLVCSAFAQAEALDSLVGMYNQAATGEESNVELVYSKFEEHIEAQGASPVTLVYLGSTEALMARDAWMPWNKMKYVEQGLAKIEKGLNLLAVNPVPLQEQRIVHGVHESFLAQAISASTFAHLPDMFNYFERGYELYLSLLAQPEFAHEPFAATAWVYNSAIEAAIRAEDVEQAKAWLAEMNRLGAEHPLTLQANQLVNQG